MLRTRHKLCRRRLEDAHIKYAILCTVSHYEDVFVKDDMVVSKFTSKYYSGFQARYSSIDNNNDSSLLHLLYMAFRSIVVFSISPLYYIGHACNFSGCGSVLIMDGNMKNRRDMFCKRC